MEWEGQDSLYFHVSRLDTRGKRAQELFHPAPSPCPLLISGQEGTCFKSRPQPAGRDGARCRLAALTNHLACLGQMACPASGGGGGRRGAAQHEQLPLDQVRQDPRRRSGTLSCGAGVVAVGARRASGQEARAQRSSPAGSRGCGNVLRSLSRRSSIPNPKLLPSLTGRRGGAARAGLERHSPRLRPDCWRLLLGYAPPNREAGRHSGTQTPRIQAGAV